MESHVHPKHGPAIHTIDFSYGTYGTYAGPNVRMKEPLLKAKVNTVVLHVRMGSEQRAQLVRRRIGMHALKSSWQVAIERNPQLLLEFSVARFW